MFANSSPQCVYENFLSKFNLVYKDAKSHKCLLFPNSRYITFYLIKLPTSCNKMVQSEDESLKLMSKNCKLLQYAHLRIQFLLSLGVQMKLK